MPRPSPPPRTASGSSRPWSRSGSRCHRAAPPTPPAEAGERFKQAMVELGLAVPPGGTAHPVDEARAVAERIGLPVIVRPAYTLGGRGTGTAATVDELRHTAPAGIAASPIGEI